MFKASRVVAIVGTNVTTLVPSQVVKSLLLILWQGSGRWNPNRCLAITWANNGPGQCVPPALGDLKAIIHMLTIWTYIHDGPVTMVLHTPNKSWYSGKLQNLITS